MFYGLSNSQTFRAIGQSLEERGVQDFSLALQGDECVVRTQSIAQVEMCWVDKVLGKKAAPTERSVEIHYSLKGVLWLQIRGETSRKNPDQIPDFFRLSQILRTVGHYLDMRVMPLLSLRRTGETFYLEFQDSGKKRLEEHGIGSFENYFFRTYLRRLKERRPEDSSAE